MISELAHLSGITPEPNPVLVVTGGIHYDVVVRLPHLPRGNDRLHCLETTLAPGGMGGNVAAAFARLGGRTRFAGYFSQDDDGEALRADLRREGVDLHWALARPAGDVPYRGFILVGEWGERAILGLWPTIGTLERAPGQAPGLVKQPEPDFAKWARRHGAQAPIDPAVFTPPIAGLYCPAAFAPWVIPSAPAALPVFMDLETGHIAAWDDDQVRRVLRRATVLFGNAPNLALLAARLAAPSVTALSASLGPIIVETTGHDGCTLHAGGERVTVPGNVVDAVDTTGAGDCFAAAFSLAYLRGSDLVEGARFANAAAALSTRRLGSRAGVPDAAELMEFRGEGRPGARWAIGAAIGHGGDRRLTELRAVTATQTGWGDHEKAGT